MSTTPDTPPTTSVARLTTTCVACRRTFTPRTTGGHPQRTCSAVCRRAHRTFTERVRRHGEARTVAASPYLAARLAVEHAMTRVDPTAADVLAILGTIRTRLCWDEASEGATEAELDDLYAEARAVAARRAA